jgi:hypothetical protein
MVQQPLTVADTADPVANAVISPAASLFVRQLLQNAIANAAGTSPGWIAEAWALLANVLMNDYLNWWNNAGDSELTDALNAAAQAINLNPPNPTRALAKHAQGLISRATRNPPSQQSALASFEEATRLAPGFARAQAQVGNQKVLLGNERASHDDFRNARNLAARHPALGYVDWGEGRAFFQEQNWPAAVTLLTASIAELPTVWYNRCYLAAAQASNGDLNAANSTMQDFLNDFGRPTLERAVTALQPRTDDPTTVAAARRAILDFIQRF